MRLPRTPPSIQEVIARRAADLETEFGKPEFNGYAHKCQADYWPWDKVRLAASSAGVDAEIAWSAIKMARMQRYQWLSLVGHDGKRLRFNIPDNVQRELMLIDQQLAGRLVADDDVPLPSDQRERHIFSALREEAIASSMLEGAATTRRDAKKLLQSGREPKTTGERMVVNNYRAILFIREHSRTPLSKEFLLELQSIVTQGTLERDDAVGRFRTDEANITVVDERDDEVVHVPPPAAELDDRVERLCQFANEPPDSGDFIHPVIRACVLHFQLGFDHPFCDGNGRTARAVFYWSMLRQGYWLFEYLPISRLIYHSPAKYVRAFLDSEADEFDVTYFLKYKTNIISRARKELREYLREKQDELREMRSLSLNDERLNHRQREVVLRGARNPDRVFTIEDHKNRFAVSYGTARSDLLRLSDWGYLTYSRESKRYDFHPSEKMVAADVE